MPKKLTDRVDFGFIRYANCWEDAEILLKGLSPRKGSRILSIGSAGDNSFSLLTTEPELVVAVDVNPVQLFLIELKRACFLNFDRDETLAFLGFTAGTNRYAQFNRLKKDLGGEALEYWETHLDLIEAGVIHQGKFERYFQMFVKKILPWIHSRKTVDALFEPKSADAQKQFYDATWNNWRWRLLFRIFFSRAVMGRYGRDPEFMKEVDVHVGQYIFKRAEQQLSSMTAQTNFILRYNLCADFGVQLPHYLQAGNYEKIQQQIGKLVLFKGYAEEACVIHGKFDTMNLSNIFEYLDAATFFRVASVLLENMNPGGRLAYWNLMVPRGVAALLPAKVTSDKVLAGQLMQEDAGFFYSRFVIDTVN